MNHSCESISWLNWLTYHAAVSRVHWYIYTNKVHMLHQTMIFFFNQQRKPYLLKIPKWLISSRYEYFRPSRTRVKEIIEFADYKMLAVSYDSVPLPWCCTIQNHISRNPMYLLISKWMYEHNSRMLPALLSEDKECSGAHCPRELNLKHTLSA